MGLRILVVDNYDSFVYNLVQYLEQLGAHCEVLRNDEAGLFYSAGEPGAPAGVLLSPGPGTPEAAGRCVDLVGHYAGSVPVLGVCLGLQAIAVAYGGRVSRAPELFHGKTSRVHHDGRGVLAGLPSPFTATRYHSLAVDAVPVGFEPTSWTESGVLMSMRHRTVPVEGVQFHPESVLTEGGHRLLANWLAHCGDPAAIERSAGLKAHH